MNNLFLDSSALAKRYLPEKGTEWLREQLAGATSIIVSRLASVEVMSAVTRRHREGVLDSKIVADINQLLGRHFQTQYLVIDLTETLSLDAIHLLTIYPLRAYDAIQLATARAVNERLVRDQLSPLIFVCADTRLLEIAESSGLAVDNPNNHA